MDQPTIIQRVQEWWRRRPAPRPSVALHLVNLQERFGPSSLSGLADTAALFNITAPVAHCETVTSRDQQDSVTDATLPVGELGELPSMVRTLVPESLPPTPNPITIANLSSELDWNIATPYNVPDVPNAPVVCAATGANDTPTVPTASTPNIAPSVATTRPAELPALSLPNAAPSAEPNAETPPTPTDKQPLLEPAPEVDPPAEESASDGATKEAEQEWGFPEIEVPSDELPAEDWTAYPSFGESNEASLEQVFQDEPGPNTNKADGDALPTTTVTVGPQVRLEASADSAPAPKVTTSATPKSDTLRLSRPSADSTPLAVNYQLSAFAGTAVVQQTGTAVIPAGAKHVDVPAHGHGMDQRAEVVTLRVQPGQGYDAAPTTTATLFRNTEGQPLGDAALFAAYRHSGSQAAFREIVARHQMSVFRVAYQVLGNRADAEDVSQLAFLVLARQDMTIHSSLHYWLQKVTRNASIALLRAKSRRLRYESELAKLAESPSPEESYAMADEVQVALAGLPAPLSEAVRLRYLEGWSQQEAAAIVGIPRGTLSQRASQGLQTLRETMLDEQREAG